MTTILLAALTVLAVLGIGTLAILLSDRLHMRAKVNRRMTSLGELVGGVDESMVPQMSAAQSSSGKATRITWLQQRYPLSGGIRTGVISVFVTLLVLVPLAAFLIFVRTPIGMALMVAVAGAIGAGWSIGSILENRKREEYNERLLLAMDDFQRMVRFGIPTMQALNSVVDTADEPLCSSLRNVLLETGFGVPLEEAVAQEARRIRISELAMLAAILSTQASTGGSLSESIGNLATMLRERRDNRAKMKAATAESRITLIILALVPVAGIGIQAVSNPEVVSTLFGDARHLLGIGVALISGAFVPSYVFIRRAQR